MNPIQPSTPSPKLEPHSQPESETEPQSQSPTRVTKKNQNQTQNHLDSTLANIQSQIESIETELNSITSQLRKPPKETVNKHIKLLHIYNETKDVGLGLMGLLAESRGETAREVGRSFGVEEGD